MPQKVDPWLEEQMTPTEEVDLTILKKLPDKLSARVLI